MPAHSQTHLGEDVPAGHRGLGFGVSDSSLHWRLYISLWCPTMLEGMVVKDGITRPSCPQGKKPMAAVVQEALAEKQYPLLYPRVLTDLCPQSVCVQLWPCPVPQFPCVLSLADGWDSILQILKDPATHRTPYPQCSIGGEHCRAVSSIILSQKSSCTSA